MHLVLSQYRDACCEGVLSRLAARRLDARLLTTPFEPPARFTWRLDAHGVTTLLALDDGPPLSVESVFIRHVPWLDPGGWEPADHAYMQSEMQAALLAWLAALPCPVVNRPSAALWYRHGNPLLGWYPLLRRCGLPTPETVLTDDAEAARRFAADLGAAGVPGTICTSLTQEAAWLVGPGEWAGLAAVQTRTPICLTEPHGAPRTACVVGGEVIWDGAASREEAALTAGLRRLAGETGLDFLEVAVAPCRNGPAVVLVEPRPRLEHFSAGTQATILDALTDLLAAPARAVQEAAQ
ncbi:ATP-grasp domain-containing protein [Elioraea rosea]|uniref:hypothetical protein n=1 Tax=Elioraea rosea TaxID=2492390 RepID=UPI001184DF76|nr:hypothetical protein [Elioraea rosea]